MDAIPRGPTWCAQDFQGMLLVGCLLAVVVCGIVAAWYAFPTTSSSLESATGWTVFGLQVVLSFGALALIGATFRESISCRWIMGLVLAGLIANLASQPFLSPKDALSDTSAVVGSTVAQSVALLGAFAIPFLPTKAKLD